MSGAIVITNPNPDRIRAIALKGALKIHIATNGQMRANRAYTPTRVLAACGELTGKKYKRGQQPQALLDIEQWLEAQS